MRSFYQASAGIDRLEQLAMGDSVIHRVHPMAKLVTTIVYVVVVVSFQPQNVSGLAAFLFYPLILMPLSDTPYRPLLGRLLLTLPFSLAGGVSSLILSRGTAFYIGSFSVSFGMVSFTSIMLKTLLTVFAVLVLISTTSLIEISHQLTALRIPRILCLQLVMTYRYLSALLGEAVSMFTAYVLRSPNQKGIRMKDMGSFLGQLILRSFDRAECVYQAMKCRGFQGVYLGKIRGGLSLSDWMYAVGLSVLIVGLRMFNLSLFFGRLI